MFLAPTTAENTFTTISHPNRQHNSCHQHLLNPFGRIVKTRTTTPPTVHRKHKKNSEKKPPITTKQNSRSESNYFLWFFLIILSYTNCYLPQIFKSKQITPLRDRKFITHSCFCSFCAFFIILQFLTYSTQFLNKQTPTQKSGKQFLANNPAQLSITNFFYYITLRMNIYFSFFLSLCTNISQCLHTQRSVSSKLPNLLTLPLHNSPHVLIWNNHLWHSKQKPWKHSLIYQDLLLVLYFTTIGYAWHFFFCYDDTGLQPPPLNV